MIQFRPCADHRARLIAFIDPWASVRQAYRVRLGDRRLPFEALTTAYLEEIAETICRAFWSDRKSNRRNRAIWASRATDTTLPLSGLRLAASTSGSLTFKKGPAHG